MVRLFPVLAAALLAGCAHAPPPPPKIDVTLEPWYSQTVDQVRAMSRSAEGLMKSGRFEEAAAIITNGQGPVHRLLSAPRPTLAAMEAVSDLDRLYGEMLLHNRHYVWARVLFQKNLTRWKNWSPPTAESQRRAEEARTAIAECDRHPSD